MPDPTPVTPVVQYTLWNVLAASLVAAAAAGFWNPAWTFFEKKFKKKSDGLNPTIAVAEIKRDERTEDKLWQRIECLERRLEEETEKRLASERAMGELQRQVDELTRAKLSDLARYIRLKLRIGEAQKEIEYLKSKLREKDPNFDIDYPSFSLATETMEDERLIAEISRETDNKGADHGLAKPAVNPDDHR